MLISRERGYAFAVGIVLCLLVYGKDFFRNWNTYDKVKDPVFNSASPRNPRRSIYPISKLKSFRAVPNRGRRMDSPPIRQFARAPFCRNINKETTIYAIKHAEQYEESLRKMNFKVYMMGEQVKNAVDHPIIRPSMNSVKMTYTLAQDPQYADLMTATSSLTGKRSIASAICTRAPRIW